MINYSTLEKEFQDLAKNVNDKMTDKLNELLSDALKHYHSKIEEFLLNFITKQGGVVMEDLTFVNVQHGQFLPTHLQGKEIQHFILKVNGTVAAQTWLFWVKDVKQ